MQNTGIKISKPSTKQSDPITIRSNLDDGTREQKIFSCEYRVLKQALIDVLSYYGELQSDVVEELFDDGGTGNPETDGTINLAPNFKTVNASFGEDMMLT